MNQQNFVLLALQLATMLGCALVFGQLMRKFKQPAVLGEMLGGIILGPTILGAVAPSVYMWLFQSAPTVSTVREASIKLGMLFFLFVAGLEVNLSDLRRLGRGAILIGFVGTVVPIIAGVGLVYLLPADYWGPQVQAHFFAFALFVGMNLANSANPVIARVLMDLGLLKHEIGTMIMTATIIDDLINWTLFAIILQDIAPTRETASSLPVSIGLVLAFFVVVLGLGRKVGPPTLHWLRGHVQWPSGFMAATALLILLASGIAEWLGIHAFLGAFLVGAALGSDSEEGNEAHDVINHFALSFFAPIYFVSMGLTVNFVTHFDATLVALVITVAFASKMGGVLLGARMAGLRIGREVLAMGFGLNARGATGIILAGVGREYQVIDDRIFVVMVVMALFTSLISGPMIKLLLAGPLPTGLGALDEALPEHS